MMEILLFPLNEDTETLALHMKENPDYHIRAVSGYQEDTEKLREFQRKSGIFVSVDFRACLDMTDAVIFAESTMGHGYYGYEERIQLALESEKNIFMSLSMAKKVNICENNPHVHLLQNITGKERKASGQLKEIPVPVISVLGAGENCGKFKLQVQYHHQLEKRGYKVLTICSNPLGKFLNMEILPGFLFSEDLSFQKKIEMFNKWIYELQDGREADVIVLGYPGGILPLNEIEPNHYGEVPLVISNAVISDTGILAEYGAFKQDAETEQKMKELCFVKYNTVISGFAVSQNYYKTNYEERKVRYRKKDSVQLTDDNRGRYAAIENEEEIERQIDRLIAELGDNFFAI